jgi:uncharacterized membrane protein YfcA
MPNTFIYSVILPSQAGILGLSGLVAGLLAGILGIGGGNVLVPILLLLGYAYAPAVATSSLAIVLAAISGTWQNWRMGYLKPSQVILLGLPGVYTAFWAAGLVNDTPTYILKGAFGVLLLLSIYFSIWRDRLKQQENTPKKISPWISRILTGGLAGFLAGLFGIGGGVVMVPLQMWFLGETIKVAIQTSLGVIVITAVAACWGHAREGNVLWLEGLILGMGGLLGAQVSTRFLPRLPENIVRLCFSFFLLLLSLYFFVQSWQDYENFLR